MNQPIQRLIVYLWWGPFRRPFEAFSRRLLINSTIVRSGPLRGMYFDGGLAQKLGIYEPYLQELLLQQLRQDGIFFDIGANNGFFTLLAAKIVGETGLVYAFEPLPRNISYLKTHIDQNQRSNCFVIEKAVSDKTGSTKLFCSQGSATPSIVHTSEVDAWSLVQTITLDEFVTTHPTPTLVKMDIEGAEVIALKGAHSLLGARNAPDWLIEVHNRENDHGVNEMLARAGYKILRLKGPRGKTSQYPYHLFAYKDA